jgi:hypothetical protein
MHNLTSIKIRPSKPGIASDTVRKSEKERDVKVSKKPITGNLNGEMLLDKIKENLIEKEIEDLNKTDCNYYSYYCSLCGANVILTDTVMESMPRRTTDDSMIVLVSKLFFKSYLKRDKLMVIKRDTNKYEKQFRFICHECGVFIAYQCLDYEESETSDEMRRRSNKIFSQNKKRILFILVDAVVTDPRHSSLFIELEKHREIQDRKIINKY